MGFTSRILGGKKTSLEVVMASTAHARQGRSSGPSRGENNLSNEKRAPGWLGYIGDDILPSYIGIIIKYDIRIPINHPVFHGK